MNLRVLCLLGFLVVIFCSSTCCGRGLFEPQPEDEFIPTGQETIHFFSGFVEVKTFKSELIKRIPIFL